MTRSQILRRAFLAPESFVAGELRLRPFSLWSLDVARELGLEYFLETGRRFSAAEKRRQVSALAWSHLEEIPEEEIDRAILDGSWSDRVGELRRRPELTSHFPAFVEYLETTAREVAAATVKVIEKPSEKQAEEKDKDRASEPKNLVEPISSASIIWTLSGGQLLEADQFSFLYRRLPLPRVLAFYHCALFAALKWTVPVDSKEGVKKQIEKARGVRDRLDRGRKTGRKSGDFF